MSDQFIPQLVTEWVDRLRDDTQCDSTVERINDRKWRLTAESDRVTLTLDFILQGNGKVRWKGSTLAVDGTPRALAEDYEHLLRIFMDPDGDMRPPEVMEMPPARCVDDAPFTVRTFYGILSRFDKDAAEIGERDGAWIVGLGSGDTAIRLVFTRRRKEWGMGRLQVIVNGVDRSAEVRGDVTKALALMAGESPAVPGEKVIGMPARPARTNSVEIRRAAVIRT